MRKPSIGYQNMQASEAVTARIREEIEDLEKFHPRIIGCNVVVDAPHRHGAKGNQFEVRLDISVPGDNIAVSRQSDPEKFADDVYIVIRDTFEAARRLLSDRTSLMDGYRQKRHPDTEHGEIVRLFAAEGYGFIKAMDGEEVYFQEDSMTRSVWGRLQEGGRVRFKRLNGDKGPFAVQVTPVGKNTQSAD